MRRPFHIPAGTRLVSAVPDLDWDRWLAEVRTKREAREAAAAEAAKHHAGDVAGGGIVINIGGSVGGQVEVGIDLALDRVAITTQGARVIWLTDAQADRLADNVTEAARELRRRRGERNA